MSKHNTKTLAIRGVVWNAVTHIASIAVTFVATPIILNGLGIEVYGIWSIVVALTGYYGLINMGIGKANTKYIAQFDALDDRESVLKVVSTGFALFLPLAVFVIVLSALVAWIFPFVFDLGAYPWALVRWVILLTGLKVAVQLVGQVFRAGIGARKRFDVVNALAATSLVLVGVSSIVVVLWGGGLLGMAVVALVVASVHQLSAFAISTSFIGLPRPRIVAVCRKTGKSLLSFGILNLVIQVVRRTSLIGGSIILGIIAGPAAVGYYSVAESLTCKSLNLGKVLNHVVMPFASQFDAEGNRYALKRMAVLSTRLLLALSLSIVIALFAFGASFFTFWISSDVADNAFPIICVLSLSLLAKLPSNGIHSALVGMGQMKFLSRLAIAEGIAIVSLGVILTPMFGAVGMAWAIVVPQIVFSGLMIPIYFCRQLRLPAHRFGGQVLVPAMVSAIPGLAMALFLRSYAPPQHLGTVVLAMMAVGATTGISAFLFCLNSDTRETAIRALLGKKTRKTPKPAAGSLVERP